MKQRQQEISKEREKDCTFKPALSPKVQRIQALTLLKKKALSTAQKTPERKTPHQRSRDNSTILEEREHFNPVQFFKRNLEWRNRVERRKKSIVQQVRSQEVSQATFKPQISNLAQEIHQKKIEKLKMQQTTEGS